MSSQPRGRSAAPAVLLLVVLTLLTTTAGVPTVAATGGSLTVSPGEYVGGQRLLFEGTLGTTGRRKVHLELNLSRPGDEWNDVQDFTPTWTEADGSFRFGYTAPAMFGIRMRVASGSLATPAWTFDAKSQDLVMRAKSGLYELADNEVVAGEPFRVEVDTTADLVRRPDSPSPVFPGRMLTLERRTDEGLWDHVASSMTDSQGNGVFLGIVALEAGEAVYRVRQEDWTTGGDQVGWYPSFPTYVEVLPSARAARTRASAVAEPAPVRTTSTDSTPLPARDVASTTASQTWGWTPSLWDFGWTYGESLTSPPGRGTDPVGWWLDSSTGTGRAAKHNGGLMLDSQRDNKDGVGLSTGTTRATLQDNPMRYGRWEVRLRVKSTDTSRQDFRTVVDLVPDGNGLQDCGGPVITIADVAAHDDGVRFGARAGGAQWIRTHPDVQVNGTSHAFGVEVTAGHITWFVEGRPVGTVRSSAAVPDVPLTLRVRQVGDGQRAMNRTQSIFDWMRGFPLDTGEKVTSGPRLDRRDAAAC